MKTLGHIILLFILIQLSGCGSYSSHQNYNDVENKLLTDEKIIADAYLFDSKIIQNKKVTSVRLEFYHSDKFIGLNGRGYLGKGALKGYITSDSLKVYFPVTNEFVDESIEQLFQSFSCEGEIGRFELTALFKWLPEEFLTDESFKIEILKATPKRIEYNLSVKSCQWELNIEYDQRGHKWRIRNFSFSDGKDTVLKGKRREIKTDVKVKISRFQYNPPADATQITP